MIFSENRFPLFGIMLWRPVQAALTQPTDTAPASIGTVTGLKSGFLYQMDVRTQSGQAGVMIG
jgi:hypothetical protein